MQFDPSAIFACAISWITDHILFELLWKALGMLGMSVLITALFAWFSDKLARWKDRIVFGTIVFVIGIIAINSFGYRAPKPYLYFEQYRILVGTHDEIKSEPPNVFVFANLTNRGTAVTVAVNWLMSVDINERTYKGQGILFHDQIKVKIGDKEESLDPNKQLNVKRALPPGIPFEGFVAFRIADAPISIFSNRADYTITIIDSYGNSYVVKATSHGEFMTKRPE